MKEYILITKNYLNQENFFLNLSLNNEFHKTDFFYFSFKFTIIIILELMKYNFKLLIVLNNIFEVILKNKIPLRIEIIKYFELIDQMLRVEILYFDSEYLHTEFSIVIVK